MLESSEGSCSQSQFNVHDPGGTGMEQLSFFYFVNIKSYQYLVIYDNLYDPNSITIVGGQ